MTELEEIIKSQIQAAGAISFARFMELALYHPRFGYYERHGRQTGRAGDFYTSVSVGSVYGELLGFEFAQRLRRIGPEGTVLIEAGAHDAVLARDLLAYLADYAPDVFNEVTYVLMEPSENRAQRQRETLGNFQGKARWVSSWEEMDEFRGICFSNELLDAMPLHIFRWDAPGNDWREWGVTSTPHGFLWTVLPVEQQSTTARKMLAPLPEELLQVLPNHFTVEISPEAVRWWLQASHSLQEGWNMTVDYGFLQEDFFAPQRAKGTLRAYSRHQVNSEVLDAVGEQDLTAHVNFSLLMSAGESAGLKQEEFVPQGIFLKKILEKIETVPDRFPLWTPMRFRQLTSLIHPEHLGRSFKVLVQSRLPAG